MSERVCVCVCASMPPVGLHVVVAVVFVVVSVATTSRRNSVSHMRVLSNDVVRVCVFSREWIVAVQEQL